MEWDRMVWPKPVLPTRTAPFTGVTTSSASDLFDKNITSALLPQNDE